MKTIIKKTIIFEFVEIYALLIKNKELVNFNNFTFEVLRSSKGGFDIVAKKNISNDIVEDVILSHLKSIGENNAFVINIEGLGFVCREKSETEDNVPDKNNQENPALECLMSDLVANPTGLFSRLYFEGKLDTRTYNCLAGFGHQNDHMRLEEFLNLKKPRIRNFGAKSFVSFLKVLENCGIDPYLYPISSWKFYKEKNK